MRKPIISIALAGLFLASSLSSQAADAPAVKLVTVNIPKALASFWKTQNSENQFEEAAKAAQDYLEKEGVALDEIKKNLDAAMEQSKNTALSKEAQERAVADARQIYQQWQEKGQQAEQFKQNKERELGQKRNNDIRMLYAEIREIVMQISRDRGATVVLDTSSTYGGGFSTIIHTDPAYDVTDDVIAILNKSMPSDFKLRPADAPAAN